MKKISLLSLFLCVFLASYAQKQNFSWENVSYGGGITLSLGNQTTIGLAPSALYNFKNGLSVGLGVGYLYSEFLDNSTISAFNMSAISIYETPFSLLLSAELEQYFTSQKTHFGKFSSNFPALHLGIAYKRGRFAFGIRYDVLYDENRSIFASPISPIVRFYF